jgi:hypothetical protein
MRGREREGTVKKKSSMRMEEEKQERNQTQKTNFKNCSDHKVTPYQSSAQRRLPPRRCCMVKQGARGSAPPKFLSSFCCGEGGGLSFSINPREMAAVKVRIHLSFETAFFSSLFPELFFSVPCKQMTRRAGF